MPKRTWRLNGGGEQLLEQVLRAKELDRYDVNGIVRQYGSLDYKTVQKIVGCENYLNGKSLENFFEKLDCESFELEEHCEWKQGRETVEVNQLAGILQELSEQEYSRLRTHYNVCCPEGFQEEPVQSVADLLSNLTEMSSLKGKPKPLLQFVALVIQDSKISEEIRQQLQEWGQQQRGFVELQGQPLPLPQTGEQSLMIVVKPVSDAPGSYRVQAILVTDPEPFNPDDSTTFETIPVSERTFTADELPDLLWELLEVCHEQHQVVLDDLSIQWFLPIQLLSLGIEQWKKQLGRRERLLSAEYRMVIRSWDRQFGPEYRLKNNTAKQRWTRMVENRQSNCLTLLASGFEDIEQMRLEITQPQVVGCRFRLPETAQEQEDLFDDILCAALPVSGWAQGTFTGQNPEASGHAIWENTIGDLPVSLTQMRREACVRAQPCLSLHLALLWDNPYRPAPHIDYAS